MLASLVLLPPSPLPPKIPSIASPSPEPADGLPWPSALRPDRRSRGAEPRNQELELEEASSGGSTTSTTHVSTEVFSPARGCQQVAMAVISLFFPPNPFHFFCAFLCLVGIGLDQCLLWCCLCSEATPGHCRSAAPATQPWPWGVLDPVFFFRSRRSQLSCSRRG